ncbi:MAG TPA: RNA 2',3'-cyclic phosphodiesterase [Ignavibacteriaceae bacterium]
MKNRLFVSLNLPDNVIEQIISLRDKICDDKSIKWESKEKLHLTIKFIGDVSGGIMNEISNELSFIIDYPSIKCSFNRFGFFYRDGKPIILWAGLNVDDLVNDLISELDDKLKKYSIPIEHRKFNPHITLLRIKKDPGISFVNNFKNFTFEPMLFTANSITLYKSVLHPNGSKYFEIKNYKLKELEK